MVCDTRARCNQNDEWASGGMEVKDAQLLWTRSTDRNLRYTTILSDGDARTFTRLTNMRVYGDVELQKEEGEPRRQTPQHCPALVGIIWEEGWGHIWRPWAHPHDVSGLHNAILVSFDHCSSTDENSEHDRVGARSWCFYQKAPATGQEPGPHRTNVGTPLAPDVAKHVKEVYTRLTSSSGAHWAKRRMRTKASILLCGANAPRRVSLAFNADIKVTMKSLCEVMQVPSGAHLLASAEKAYRRRLQQAKRQTVVASKEARFVARTRAAAATSTDYAAG
ncbi:hypothetical protein NP493_32g00009 [Ridgeia piscesae]|uniref:Uncharacterized protein n=1 Tax=Ridgeia piscesae TaxID=27915 RepID=A0AAD9UKA1_RIDPI|nr:hypothetical protein NP493_32g00009 [Ridgeia piscesae]